MTESELLKIVTIAEEGSMAKAAQKLFITQPALSKTLAKVEQELGEPLFTRSTNGLMLTYAGQYFVSKAYQIIKLYDDTRVEFCELNSMRKGLLKLGSAERIGALILPNLLKTFSKKYPNIKINIVEDNSKVLEEKIMAGALDLAIVCLPLRNPNINYNIFYKGLIYLAVPKESPLNKLAYMKQGEVRPYLRLQDVLDQDFILTKPVKKTRMAAEKILKPFEGNYRVAIESQNIETVIRLVAGGMGVSLVPACYTKSYTTGDNISYYMIEPEFQPYWEWAVIYNEDFKRLTRPSRELYRIICNQGIVFPDYLK